MAEHADPELEQSTRRWMTAGVVLMFLFVGAFPLYRLYEPEARAESRAQQLSDLKQEGLNVYLDNCASCHGPEGEGIDAPALNSKQFLFDATLEQIASIVGHGIPGSEMVAWSIDFNGPLTSEQIEAVSAFVDSWRPEAPDRPDWRTPGD
jgi:mono/diheme cytochrome c family protein